MKKFFLGLLASLLVLQGIVPFWPVPKAAAGVNNAEWLDHATIWYGGTEQNKDLYMDRKTDNDEGYTLGGKPSGCVSEIENISANGSQGTFVKRETVTQANSSNTECKETKSSISISNTGKRNDYFIWLNDFKNIRTADSHGDSQRMFRQVAADDQVFKPEGNGKTVYKNDEEGPCFDTIEAEPGTATSQGSGTGTLYIRSDLLRRNGSGYTKTSSGAGTLSPEQAALDRFHGGDNKPMWNSDVKIEVHNDQGDCGVVVVRNIRIGRNTVADQEAGSVVGATGAEAADDANDIGLDCTWSINPLTWLLCPLIDTTREIVNQLDNAITDQLTIDANRILSDTTPEGRSFHSVWANIRNIAMAVLVIAALVMVISQAFGGGPFDAYTVKRMLPRILAAAIAISLSWPIVHLLVNISNDAGIAIRALIQAAADTGSDPNIGGTTITLGGLGVVALGTALGIAGILSLAVTALVAVAIAFGVLVIREILVVVLAILAPLAIACYIMPNTERAWKLWKDLFFRALIVFPIIAAFIAAGRVLASYATEVPGGLLGGLIAFVAYFGPYFMLPMAFKMAGGAIGAVSGALNSRAAGFYQGQREKRAALRKDRIERAGSNSLWNKDFGKFKFRGKERSIGGLGNSLASWAASPGANLAYAGRNVPGLSARGQKIASQIEGATAEQTGKLFQELNSKYGFNDKAYRTIGGMHAGLSEPVQKQLKANGLYGKSLTSLGDMQKAAEILSTSDSETERIAGNALMTGAGRIASLYSDPEMTKANVQAAGALGLAAHGFATGDDLAKVGNDLVASGYSTSAAHALVTQAQVAGQHSRPDIKAGYGVLYDRDKGFSSVLDPANKGRAKALIKTIKQTDWLGAKAGAVEKLSGTIKEMATIDEHSYKKDSNGNILTKQEYVRDPNGKAVTDDNGNYVVRSVPVLNDDVQSLREAIALGASAYSSSDPTAKAEWKKLASELGMEREVAATDSYLQEQQARQAGASGGEGGGEDGGAAGGE